MCSATWHRRWREASSGAVARSLCLECWPHCGHMSMCVLAQVSGLRCSSCRQQPGEMPTKSLCSSLLKGEPATTCLFWAGPHHELPPTRLCLCLNISLFLPSQFVPICPPLDFSMCRSLRHVCALSRKSFFELLLFKLLKLKGKDQGGYQTAIPMTLLLCFRRYF